MYAFAVNSFPPTRLANRNGLLSPCARHAAAHPADFFCVDHHPDHTPATVGPVVSGLFDVNDGVERQRELLHADGRRGTASRVIPTGGPA